MVFTVYVSLLPFRLEAVPLDAAWRHFTLAMTTWPDRLPRANFLANLLLFVPIGFGLAGARLADRDGGRSGAVALALLSSVAVSLAAEFLQVFAPRRVVAASDVVAQTAGCGVGLVTWALVGQPFTVWIRGSRARANHHRFTRALVGYAALWALASWAPFDITLDPSSLAARVRQGLISVVPFAQPITPRLLWDAVVTTVGAVPIGMLAVSGWWTQATRRGAIAATVLAVGGIAVVEATQVFIRSHAADATDVLCGAVGAVGGVYIGTRLWRPGLAQPAGARSAVSRWAWTGVGLWCLMLIGYHWQPFDFAIDEAMVRQKITQISLVPFSGYLAGSDLGAFNTLVAKVAVALPLGLIAAFVLPHGMGIRLATALWIMLAGAVFGAVEAGQIFLPSRFPDLTDVWIGMAASSVGLWLGRWLRASPSY